MWNNWESNNNAGEDAQMCLQKEKVKSIILDS